MVPPTAAHRARRPRRPRLPAQPRHRRHRRPPLPARVGPRRLGRPGHRPGPARAGAAGERAGLPQPAQPLAGHVPGPPALPDPQRGGRGGRLRWAHPAGEHGSGQVQELAGDRDLPQVPGPVRAELGQERHREGRPGGRVRGLHRRHRLPPGRRADRRRDVRHRSDRGPRAAPQALRQPRRPGLRRRRRRPGRGRALLRVGATVRRRRRGGAAAAGPGPGRPGWSGSGGAPARGRGGRAVPGLPSGPGAAGRRPGGDAGGQGQAGQRGHGHGQRAPRRQRPQALRRSGGPAHGPARRRPREGGGAAGPGGRGSGRPGPAGRPGERRVRRARAARAAVGRSGPVAGRAAVRRRDEPGRVPGPGRGRRRRPQGHRARRPRGA